VEIVKSMKSYLIIGGQCSVLAMKDAFTSHSKSDAFLRAPSSFKQKIST